MLPKTHPHVLLLRWSFDADLVVVKRRADRSLREVIWDQSRCEVDLEKRASVLVGDVSP
jgi:hypothetical protein